MSAPPRTRSDEWPYTPGSGSDLVLGRGADEVVRVWRDGEAFPRIILDGQAGAVLVGDGTGAPAAPSGGGGQPLSANLTTIAALDPSTAGAIASDGAGWIKKTYAQFKTALALVKGDVGLGNVDNTADSAKTLAESQITNLVGDLSSLSTSISGKQALNAALTAISALATQTFGRSLLTLADAAAMRAAAATFRQDVFANRGTAAANPNTWFLATDDPVAGTGTTYYSDGTNWYMTSTTKGELARAEVSTSGPNTSGTTVPTDLTGATITFTLATDRVVILNANITLQNTAADATALYIRDGSSTIVAGVNALAAAMGASLPVRFPTVNRPMSLVAGTYTYKVSYLAPVTGTVSSFANATNHLSVIEALLG